MVEQEAVNFEVAGSSPAVGAKHKHYDESHGVFVLKQSLLTYRHKHDNILIIMPYTEGYHGTDEATARKLLEEGFQKETDDGWPRDVYLAAPSQTYLAHSHGQKNAERSGSLNYAILKTSIPESEIRLNDLGPESLKIYNDMIDQIAIVGLSVYTQQGRLVEGEEVPITNQSI
jgi:hypothetical protein